MHELRIASDLSEIALGAAREAKLSRVIGVNVTFGEMVAIVPDIFIAAFRSAVSGTVANDAELRIEIVPVKLRCKKCGADFQLGDNFFSCDACGSTDIDIINGKELYIKTIEGE